MCPDSMRGPVQIGSEQGGRMGSIGLHGLRFQQILPALYSADVSAPLSRVRNILCDPHRCMGAFTLENPMLNLIHPVNYSTAACSKAGKKFPPKPDTITFQMKPPSCLNCEVLWGFFSYVMLYTVLESPLNHHFRIHTETIGLHN